MTATNHGLAGATIAIVLQKYPAVAVAVAPFSHFLLDMIPHYSDDSLNKSSRKFVRNLFIDMTLAVVSTLAVAWFWPDIALLVVACAFLAASPDLMWLYYQILRPTPYKKLPWFARFHSKIQWSETRPGIVMELVWFAVLFPTLIFIGAM